MATTEQWIAGARPRTLPMAIAPVVIGSAAGAAMGSFHPAIAVLALIVGLALQVGVNYANDYSDGIRGTDDDRVGPTRLTASGAAEPARVKTAAFISFGVAGAAGIGIAAISGMWWMVAVGAVCVLAAWWYTGGSKPYGYLGLGEVMVFVFFGLVATLGTAYAMAAELSVSAIIGAVSAGLIASALLMANNVRDIPTDAETGKLTLAVRVGDRPARWAYAVMVAVAVVAPLGLVGTNPWMLLVVLSWLLCAGPIRIMLSTRHTGMALVKVLQLTGFIVLAFAATFSLALLLG